MLVQLSPWKTGKTSLPSTSGSRRRKRTESDDGSLQIQASFVTTSSRRGVQKWKRHSSELADRQPLLTLTSSHKIAVIGRSKDSEFDEMSTLQYSSRPGAPGSFIPTTGNGKKTITLTGIPALLDAKNSKIYALQNGNKRVCCWDTLNAGGPEDKQAQRVDLKKPAVSMSLLPLHKGLVFGSCVDGTIYMARNCTTAAGEAMLLVEYMDAMVKDIPIATVAVLPQAKAVGRKRKLSDDDGFTSVSIYQLFSGKKGAVLVRNDIQLGRLAKDNTLINDDSLVQRQTEVVLPLGPSDQLTLMEGVVSSGSNPAVALHYRTKCTDSKNSEEMSFGALLSLSMGGLAHPPVRLPPTVKQPSFITGTILAYAAQNSVVLHDLESGARLAETPLPSHVTESQGWCLAADPKFGTVGVVCDSGKHLSVSFSMALLDENNDSILSSKLSLSSRLASCIVGTAGDTTANSPMATDDLLRIDTEQILLTHVVKTELEAFHNACENAVASNRTSRNALIGDYENSVANVLKELQKSHSGSGAAKEHDMNGSNHSPKATKGAKKAMNGCHTTSKHAITPSVLPQSFIEGIVDSTISILSTQAKDKKSEKHLESLQTSARRIFRNALKTGKVSARRHFDSSETIQESSEENKLSSILLALNSSERAASDFSPIDLIFAIFYRCPDVSERQMVAMLRFMLRHSLPKDIAVFFISDVAQKLQVNEKDMAEKYLKLCQKKSNGSTAKSSEMAQLSEKLVLAGTKSVLCRALRYSQCNDSMLRASLHDLMDRHEATILSRILCDVLTNSGKSTTSRFAPNLNVVTSCCQWISALTDCFRDDLLESKPKNATNDLALLMQASKLASRQSQAIISLNNDLRRVEDAIEASLEAKKRKPTRSIMNAEDLPGYSVDRLVF